MATPYLFPRHTFLLAAALGAGLLASSSASAQNVVRADVVVKTGDALGNTTVSELSNPFLSPAGAPLLLLNLTDGTHVLWLDGAVLWDSQSSTVGVLDVDSTNNRATYGISSAGDWAYIPEVGSTDVLYTIDGPLVTAGGAAPGYPGGQVTFVYRSMVLPGGAIYWLQSVDTDLNGTTDLRSLMTTPDGTLGSSTVVLEGGTTLNGVALNTLIGFDYDVSDDGNQIVAELDLATGSTTNDAAVYLNGAILMQESTPVGAAPFDNWDNFDARVINNDGDWLITGDTDGSAATDEFIAVNGAIAIREGDTVAGVTLTSPAAALAVSLDNTGRAAYIWDHGTTESLFVSDDVDNLVTSARLVAQIGDSIDLDGDAVGDASIVNFAATTGNGPGINLFDNDGVVFAEVELDFDGDTVSDASAIVRFGATVCGDGSVGGLEECDTSGESASCNANCSLSACGDFLVNASAMEDCDEGGVESTTCDTDCTLPLCGDSLINTSTGEVCDDGGESAACDVDCTPVVCGDALVNVSAGEHCDDGTGAENAYCDADCTIAACGDGTVNVTAGEECDAAGESDACDLDCTSAVCGDGTVNVSAGEGCDDGNTDDGDGCSATCISEFCGNGVVDDGEVCDDGNNDDGDGCAGNCQSDETCGNSVVDVAAGEACDDGNAVDGDGCNACALPTCGDSIVDASAGEECDEGGPASSTCDADCSAVVCGDGLLNVEAGEACDPGATMAVGCNSDCTFPSCGNGVVDADAGETCDESGETAACDIDCSAVECGDGVLNITAGEACEDGNTEDGDGCSSTCLIETVSGGGMVSGGVDDDGCGCGAVDAKTASGSLLLTLLGLLAVRRRR